MSADEVMIHYCDELWKYLINNFKLKLSFNAIT